MNVNIAPRGHSNMAVTAYLVNPKRDDPEQLERMGQHETFNLPTDDLETAAKVMAWTDQNREFIQQENGGTPRNVPATAGNVYHWSISWRPDDQPSWEHMRETVLSAVEERGLLNHQFYIVEHTDEPHKHIHIVTNLVHPETGRINNCWKDRDVLDRWANEYEKEHGVQCEARAAKYEAWEQEQQAFPDRTKKVDRSEAVSTAFERSDSGKAFQAALEEQGLTLARGRRRAFVVVDQNGDITNLTKCIEFTDGTSGRGKTKRIREHLKDVAPDDLRDAESVAAEHQQQAERETEDGGEDEGQNTVDMATSEATRRHQEETSEDSPTVDRDAVEVAQQKALADAAHRAAKEQARLAAEDQKRRGEETEARKKQERRDQERRRERFQADVERKTADSRRKWQIDELGKAKEEAQVRADGLCGFWARVFQPFARRDAIDQLQNTEKQLAERTTRFQADVEAFNAKRPQWVQVRELKRQGLEKKPLQPEFQPKPKPEPEASQQRAPEPSKPAQTAPVQDDDRAARKAEFLERQRQLREEQKREPEQRRDFDRD